MPWTETSPMEERVRLIADYRSGLYSNTGSASSFALAGRPTKNGSAAIAEMELRDWKIGVEFLVAARTACLRAA